MKNIKLWHIVSVLIVLLIAVTAYLLNAPSAPQFGSDFAVGAAKVIVGVAVLIAILAGWWKDRKKKAEDAAGKR